MAFRRLLSAQCVLRLNTGKRSQHTCRKGLVLGAYEDCDGEKILTPCACRFNDEVHGKLLDMIKNTRIKAGSAHVVNNMEHPDITAVSVVGLGDKNAGYNDCEGLNECKENIRVAAGAGSYELQKLNMNEILLEPFTSPDAAAEGASLATWHYQDFLNKKNRIVDCCLDAWNVQDKDCWNHGLRMADAQNVARRLEEMPANILTPRRFSQEIVDILCPLGVSVEVRDYDWIKTHRMTAFSRVAEASCNHPTLVQLSYCGGGQDDKPLLMVGKGVTFDSGGICLKKCDKMLEYKADMAGAAVVVGVFHALASLCIPINAIALLPLTENMPGASSLKPGDVVAGASGKTIRVDDPDHEARVILSDVFTYANCLTPCILMSIATLTEGTRIALGNGASAVFTNNEPMWNELRKAGAETGDRVWRFPLWKYYKPFVNQFRTVDTVNIGRMRGGEPCIGAAFLWDFIPPVAFVHLDITSTGMLAGTGVPYLRENHMTGRPVRTLVQTMEQLACPSKKPSPCGDPCP